MDKLFDLDVDNAIWEDIGLSESDGVADVPLWLSDEQIRTGIRGILLRPDCCDEELKQLGYELFVLEEWFQEEWDMLVIAVSSTTDTHLLFQLAERKTNLIWLALGWTQALGDLPTNVTPLFLGPEPAEWAAINQEEGTDQVEQLQGLEEDDGYQELEDNDLDVGLVEHMDTLALTDGQSFNDF